MVEQVEKAVWARKGRQEGAEVRFLCPAHDDHHPSARWNPVRRVWFCDVCGAKGGYVNLAERLGISQNGHRGLGEPVAVYDYRDAEGRLAYQSLRYAPKDFRQRRPDGAGGWLYNLTGVTLVPYRLPELKSADPSASVYIVEGEKDADHLAELGLVATTNPMGAGKWRDLLDQHLRGRSVIILPDADEPGRRHAAQVAASVARVAASVRVLELPGLPDKGDVTDWLNAGGTVEQLAALAEGAPAWESVAVALDAVKPRFTLHWAREALEPQEPMAFLLDQKLALGSVNAIVGHGGSKKTYAMLDLAVCVATGEDWLGIPTMYGPVLIIDEESGHKRLCKRLGEVLRAHGAVDDPPIAFTTLARINLRDPEDVAHVDTALGDVQPIFVIVDALDDIMPGGDENSVKDVQPVMLAFRGLADKHQCAVAVIHHSNKSGGYRGSSAILGAVDCMVMVESKKDSPNIDFSSEKCRDGEPFAFSASIWFGSDTVCLKPTGAPNKIVTLSPSKGYVTRYLREHGPAQMDDVMSNADTCTPNAARAAVYALVQDGMVRRCDTGGPGQVATFEIIERDYAHAA